jgi:hypothetical protein
VRRPLVLRLVRGEDLDIAARAERLAHTGDDADSGRLIVT